MGGKADAGDLAAPPSATEPRDAAAAIAPDGGAGRVAAPPGFWLGGTMPLGADFVSISPARVEATAPGELALDPDHWRATVVRRLDDASAHARALRGTALAIYAGDGAPCEASIEQVFAVRTLEVPFELRLDVRDPARRPAIEDTLWRAATDGHLAVSVSGCEGVLAVSTGEPAPALVRLAAATAEVDASVRDAFERGRGQDLDAKAELEGLSGTPWSYISTRSLSPRAGPALGVAYVKIFGARTIALFPLPPIGGNWPLVEVAAESPSIVVGVDADADGVIDAVIAHPDGAALYLAGAERLVSVRGGALIVEP